MQPQDRKESLKERLYRIIFESDTPTGRRFDILLLYAILLSTLVVMLESVREVREAYGFYLTVIEWVFTIVFTVEYIVRLYSARKTWGYVFSFYGLIDLLSILPEYLSLLAISSQYLMVIRIFRLMRVFRVLKLARFMRESDVLLKSFQASRAKIAVFLFAVLNVAVIMGTIMYIVEGEKTGFTSIPRSIYWAVVTMTTVGYGDIRPDTAMGQFLALILMILGYGIIAVPTGLVGVEVAKNQLQSPQENVFGKDTICNNCGHTAHLKDARYCQNCGASLG